MELLKALALESADEFRTMMEKAYIHEGEFASPRPINPDLITKDWLLVDSTGGGPGRTPPRKDVYRLNIRRTEDSREPVIPDRPGVKIKVTCDLEEVKN